MVKKLSAGVILLASACLAGYAEGYQVNTLSARQNGMGHTGVAQKLGSESMIFNPAGMAFMESDIDFRASMTAVIPTATATLPDGSKYKTDNPISTPMSVNLGFNILPSLKGGISFYTPYGSGIKWGDTWPGSVLNESVTLKTFSLQPTLAWRVLPNLSVGAGAMITWGSVDLNKGLVPADSFNGLLSMMGRQWPLSDPPASVNLNGKSKLAAGFNVGVLWDINSSLSIGASFRSKMRMKVNSGLASLKYANEQARIVLQNQLDVLDQSEFASEMPCPYVLNIGAAWRPVSKLLLAFDAQLTGWHTYRSLDINFLSEQLTAYNQHLPKNYRDSWTFKLGSQYSLTEKLDLRLGLMIDTTPVRNNHYNPETPGMTKLSPSAGLSYSPVKFLSIDAALQYVAGLGENDASVTYRDLLSGRDRVFTADYHVHAWNPSIGLSVKF